MTELAEAAKQTNAEDPGELAHRIVDVASDKKASDIVLLRTAEVTTMADYFVIASGRSDRQVQALSKAIVDELRDEGIKPLGVEGLSQRPMGAARLRQRDRPPLRARGARVLRPGAPLEQRGAGGAPGLTTAVLHRSWCRMGRWVPPTRVPTEY